MEQETILVQMNRQFGVVDKQFVEVHKKFAKMELGFKKLDGQFDSLAITVYNHEERLIRIEENMVTKKDHQEVMNTLDEILKFVKKKDQELIMVTHGMRRHEDRIQKLEDDNLNIIKPALGLR